MWKRFFFWKALNGKNTEEITFLRKEIHLIDYIKPVYKKKATSYRNYIFKVHGIKQTNKQKT